MMALNTNRVRINKLALRSSCRRCLALGNSSKQEG
jgi:hypothetical protein